MLDNENLVRYGQLKMADFNVCLGECSIVREGQLEEKSRSFQNVRVDEEELCLKGPRSSVRSKDASIGNKRGGLQGYSLLSRHGSDLPAYSITGQGSLSPSLPVVVQGLLPALHAADHSPPAGI